MSARASGRGEVTVIIPCFNYASYLGDAIDSALAQTVRVDVLVVDDGSTDETPEVARRYRDRVGYIGTANRGLPRARNLGASLVTTPYIVFLDADDQLAPTYVEACLGALSAHEGCAFAYTQYAEIRHGVRERTSTAPEYDLRCLLEHNFIHASALLRTELVRQCPYDDRFSSGSEDWDFYLTLAEQNLVGVLVDEPLLLYRQHDDSMAHSLMARPSRVVSMRLRMAWKHRKLYGGAVPLTKRLLRIVRRIPDDKRLAASHTVTARAIE